MTTSWIILYDKHRIELDAESFIIESASRVIRFYDGANVNILNVPINAICIRKHSGIRLSSENSINPEFT